MRNIKHAITLASLVAISAFGLYSCGGTSPTATTVAPTATTVVKTEPTATTEVMVEPTATTEIVAEPTATTEVMVEPTATTETTMEAPTATPGDTGSTTGGSNSSDAISLLKRASDVMKAVKSYHIIIKTESSGTTSTSEGDLQVPDKMRIVVDAAGSKTTMIIVDNTTYMQMPGSDAFVELTSITNPMGTASALGYENFAEGATIVGDETLDGTDTTLIKFSYDMNKAMDAAAKALGEASPTPSTSLGRAEAEIWVEKSTGYVHQYRSTSQIAGVTSTTTITYSKFNEEIIPPIEKPTNIQQMPAVPSVAVP